jgi:hypothetical protein
MKKALLVLSVALASCTSNNCYEAKKSVIVKELHSKSSGINRDNWALTQDREVYGDVIIENDLNLNGHSLTVYGHVQATNLNGGGTLTYCSKNITGRTQNKPTQVQMDCNTLGLDEVEYVQETYDCE